MLDIKNPEESVLVEFDYTGELTAPTIAVVSIAVVNGVDPDAATMIVGAPQFSGAKVIQRISAGIDKTNYKVKCVATQGNDIRVRADILPVRAA